MSNAEELTPIKRALLQIREMREQLDDLEAQRTEPIAIVGMGLRFPGEANSPDQFWELLRAGRDAIEPIPAERWNLDDYYDADYSTPGKMYTRGGGFLKDIARFDAPFFGISPREATSMDPQQRILLEVTWEALEHAGQSAARLYSSPTGVFLAMGNSDYGRMVWSDTENIDVYYATGTAFSVAAGRLSYLLGLQGPAMTLDTACSGSLVAVHLACQSLRSRESHLALAGGINLILTPEANINFSKAQMLAPDSHCKTFDAAADGYVRSEGVGMVVLKRLSDALADQDTIYALVRGSAVNQDGRSNGLTAPNGPSQEAVIRRALENADLFPQEIQYVEAHGTGTSLGDPIEIHALGATLGTDRKPDQPLKVGSVKTNLGHLEAAAGIAGLIKTALALHHEAIPPHLNFSEPSPQIDWASYSIEVNTSLTPWPRGAEPRFAGVSSFGFSGTNAHVILEEAPLPEPQALEDARPQQVLALSAKSPAALQQRAAQMLDFLAAHPDDFRSILYTAHTGRSHFDVRLGLSAATSAEMQAQLQSWLNGAEVVGLQTGRAVEVPELAFLFSGQGEQYIEMGRELYETEPLFRSVIDECAALLESEMEAHLLAVLYPAAGNETLLDQMTYAQPAIFSIEYALAKLWESWGIVPTAVLGHSVGEYAAACFAGVFSLADGLKLVAARGRLMDGLDANGTMVAVFGEAERIAPVIEPYADRVAIAAINAPKNVVISGDVETLETIMEALRADRIRSQRLAVTQASHSPLMEPMLDEFEAIAKTVSYRAPRFEYVSAVLGRSVNASEITNAGYWRRHSRQGVLFATGMQALYDGAYRVFVEIGPNPSLLPNARRSVPEKECVWLPSLRQGWSDWTQMLDSLVGLYVAGCEIDWERFEQPRQKLPIPVYPWEGGRYWLDLSTVKRGSAQPLWEAVVQKGEQQAKQGPLDLGAHTYPAKWQVLADLTQYYITKTLLDWGIFATAGEHHNAAELMQQLGIVSQYDLLLTRWLDKLVEAGLLQRKGELYSNTAPLPALDAEAIRQEAKRLLADTQPLLAYIERCGRNLAAVLTGNMNPLETLFPGGSYETVDYMYRDYPSAAYFNHLILAALQAALENAGSRTLRVLEVGAGTGGTTAALLAELPLEQVAYQFTDVNEAFLSRAAQRFPKIQTSRWDLTQDPQAQGYAPGSFDVIVASNVLHMLPILDQTLQYIGQLLAPGALLVLCETTEQLDWHDITGSLIEDLRDFEDEWHADALLLSAQSWREALLLNGFPNVAIFPEANLITRALGQHVLVAQAPGSANLGVAGQWLSQDAALAAETAVPVASFLDELRALPPADQLDLLVELVREQVRQVLRMGPSQPLDRRDRLMDIGFNSLMAVDLRSRLTARLALEEELPATLMFDYPTPQAIAEYLLRLLLVEAVEEVVITPVRPAEFVGADIQDLSDEEVEAMLLKKLKGI